MQSEDAVTERIYGVDFSGAKQAGKKIWIAEGVICGGQLVIVSCMRAAALPGSDRALEVCLPKLREFIAGSGNAAWGLDFPFGLPRVLIGSDTWEEFILAFPDRFPNAEGFRKCCRELGGVSLLKRITDIEENTPFSPYFAWMYRQTFYGIRDILYPLVCYRQAFALPMQQRQVGMPAIYEICPASTLEAKGLKDGSYKRKTAESRQERESILRKIEREYQFSVAPDIIPDVLNDSEGDALDSIIAAAVVHHIVLARSDVAIEPVREEYLLEGRVYV